jgi:hypothetical protein
MSGKALSIARFVLGHPVGRRRPLRCLADTLVWQLRASSRPRIVPFAGGGRLWAHPATKTHNLPNRRHPKSGL